MTLWGIRGLLLYFSFNYIMIILERITQTQLPVLSLLPAHILKFCSYNKSITLIMVPLCISSTEIHYVHLIIRS